MLTRQVQKSLQYNQYDTYADTQIFVGFLLFNKKKQFVIGSGKHRRHCFLIF